MTRIVLFLDGGRQWRRRYRSVRGGRRAAHDPAEAQARQVMRRRARATHSRLAASARRDLVSTAPQTFGYRTPFHEIITWRDTPITII